MRRSTWLPTLRFSISTLALVTAGVFPSVAHAQSAGATPVAAPAPQASDETEIIVTAQKRSERLSDVPMSITAVSGDRLQTLGIQDVSGLVKITPGLNYVESNYGTPVYSIRGLGFYDSSLSSTPAVTVYVDQIPLPYPQQTRNVAFDLQRVEVLKGPQGTLFGQNSTGGAINFIANRPTDQLSYGIDVNYGRFNSVDATAYISGPLTDTVRARLAVGTRQSDDWQRSYTRDDSRGQADILQGRFLLDWQAGDLRVELGASGWRDRSDPQAAQLIAVTPNIPAVLDPRLASYPLAPRSNRAADFTPGVGDQRDDSFYQFFARADYSLAEDYTLTSISAYSRLKLDFTLDGDGTNLHVFEPTEQGFIRTFSQEVRFSGDPTPELHFVLGGNYQNDSIFDRITDGLGDGTTARQFLPASVTRTLWFSRTHVETFAAFGSAEYKITPTLTVQGGLRYTRAERQFQGCLLDDATDNGALFAVFQGLSTLLRGAGGLPPVAFQRGGCITLGPTFEPFLQDTNLDEQNVSWRASVDWRAAEGTLLYANISRGYKSGTFGMFGATNYNQYQPVRQESVIAYEAGIRSSLLGRALQVDAAVFYYDYQDKQLRGNILIPIFGPLETVLNIPKSHVYGVELNAIIRPLPSLTIRAGATYVRSEVDGSFMNFSPYGVPTDFGGAEFPYTPHLQFTGDAQYDFTISDRLRGFVGATLYHQSGAEGAFGGGQLLRIQPYTLLDLRAGIVGGGGRWRASIWARNVTNTYYFTNAAFTPPDTTIRFTGRPATFGVRLGFDY